MGFALAIMLVLPLAVNAVDMTGKYGLGYFKSEAPVGARFWVSPQLGIDVGVGFESKSVYLPTYGATDTTYNKETGMSFYAEVGFPYVIFDTERANFFIRPGFMLGMLDDRIADGGTGMLDEKWTLMSFSLAPGAEIFFGDNFSLEAGHGIAIDMLKAPDADGIPEYLRGETITTIRSFDASVTYLGFHFYFK
jgi:hypothetical protein